ncbi:hypothetical protein PO124_00350 [Bacillus licheniformis]|nr:hypothetical protein [Bacillus licheniformis]
MITAHITSIRIIGANGRVGNQWITDHIAMERNRQAGRLEEYGYQDKSRRDYVYRTWLELIESRAVRAANLDLTGIQDDGTLYPDYDGFGSFIRALPLLSFQSTRSG